MITNFICYNKKTCDNMIITNKYFNYKLFQSLKTQPVKMINDVLNLG